MTSPRILKRYQRRRGSALAAGTLLGLVAVVGGGLATVDLRETPVAGGLAAKYIPADGDAGWIVDHTGQVSSAESSRSIGYSEVVLLPPLAFSTIIESLADTVRTSQFWRETHTSSASGATRTLSDLYLLSDRGVELVTSLGGDVEFVFTPGLLELPADAVAGVSWTGSGDGLPGGLIGYELDATATVPTDLELIDLAGLSPEELSRCLQVQKTVDYDADGAVVLTVVSTELWCEGQGRIVTIADVGGDRVTLAPSAPPDPARNDTRLAPTWVSPAQWTLSQVEATARSSYLGDYPLSFTPSVGIVRTASGLLMTVDSTGDDLIAWALHEGELLRDWYAHPGGEIIGLATVGNITIVNSGLRKTVAYSEQGIRLWSRDTAELVVAPPSPHGDGVILVGLDGQVVRVDALSGEESWSVSLGTDVLHQPVIAGDTVVVVDRGGTRYGLDAATGEERWKETGPATAVAAADGSVVIHVDGDGWARAYRGDDGDMLWRSLYRGSAHSVSVLGGNFLLVTDEATLLLDVDTGETLATAPPAENAASDGTHAILLTVDEAILIDESLEELTRWSFPAAQTTLVRYLAVGPAEAWFVTTGAPILRVGSST